MNPPKKNECTQSPPSQIDRIPKNYCSHNNPAPNKNPNPPVYLPAYKCPNPGNINDNNPANVLLFIISPSRLIFSLIASPSLHSRRAACCRPGYANNLSPSPDDGGIVSGKFRPITDSKIQSVTRHRFVRSAPSQSLPRSQIFPRRKSGKKNI